jgi:hypothetical protein
LALKVTADPITRVIQLLEAPVGGLASIDVQYDLYSRLKEDWLVTPDLRKLHFCFNTEGGTVVTTGKKSGAYFFLRNDLGWRIRPFDADHELTIEGMLYPSDITIPMILTPANRTIGYFNERSNLAQSIASETDAVAVAAAVWVASTSGHAAGSMGFAAIYSLYQGSIWIDTKNGTAGTVIGVNGTQSNPSATLADATVLATALGSREFRIVGGITLTEAFDDSRFVGLGAEASVNINGQDVSDSYFENLALSGSVNNSTIRTQDCLLDGLTLFRGSIVESRLNNSLSLAPGVTVFDRCSSAVAGGSATPIVDAVGAGRIFQFRNYAGGVEFQNMTDSSNIGSVDLSSGQIILASSCSGGAVVLRGVGDLTNNSTGTDVKFSALVSNPAVAQAVRTELTPELDDIGTTKDHARATNSQTQGT